MDSKLICYKMTHDSGFAPNPFHGYLTLATCKPAIRRSLNTHVGDWIAGWSSCTLNGTKTGEERLVYLAQISEIISIEEYWNRKDFECKKVIDSNNHNSEFFYGDNIYEPLKNGKFHQHPNHHHDKSCLQHDTNGKRVLICKTFYYFPVVKQNETHDFSLILSSADKPKNMNLGRGHRIITNSEEIQRLISIAKKEFEQRLVDSKIEKKEYIKKIRNIGMECTKTSHSTCKH